MSDLIFHENMYKHLVFLFSLVPLATSLTSTDIHEQCFFTDDEQVWCFNVRRFFMPVSYRQAVNLCKYHYDSCLISLNNTLQQADQLDESSFLVGDYQSAIVRRTFDKKQMDKIDSGTYCIIARKPTSFARFRFFLVPFSSVHVFVIVCQKRLNHT